MRKTPTDFVLAAYAILSALLLVINVLTDRSTIWAIWPIWALGGITAAIVGMMRFPQNRLLAIWIGAGSILIAGLAVINLSQGGSIWFFWPAGVWLVIGILLIGMTVDLLASIPTSRLATEDELDQERQRSLPPG